jgi:predicted RNase H-like HicB family nuclease
VKLNFTVLIEQGEDGAYIATVPSLKSCYTQANNMPELLEKIREVILLCLDVENDIPPISKLGRTLIRKILKDIDITIDEYNVIPRR